MATDLERLVVQLSADVKGYERAMNKAIGTTQKRANEIERRFGAMNSKVEKSFAGMGARISSSLDKALKSTVAFAGTALGVNEIVKYADAWTEAGNKIGAAAAAAGVESRSLNQLKDGANDARTAFGDYVDLYARLIRSASGVAQSEQEIAAATNIVSKAFKAGGASASEQAAGILQLGQALGSGVLQGDELRSLRENAPILAEAIAKEFKTTIAGLKDLGAEGKLTSDRVFKAILNAQKPIEAQFKATNSTISDAMTRINNEFTAYIGNADSSAGATGKLVEALNFLADNFKEVGNVVLEFVTILVGALTGRALVAVVAGLANAVVALGAFITAVRTGALVAGSLAAALGPIGVIAGAAAAAIYLYGDGLSSAERASIDTEAAIRTNATALDAAKASSEGYTRALRNQIAMQLEVAKSEAAAASAYADAATDRAVAFTRYASMMGVTAKFDPFEYAANQAEIAVVRTANAATALQMQLDQVDKGLGKSPSGFGNGSGAAPAEKKKKTRENEYQREIEQITKRTDALKAETSAQAGLNPLLNDYGFAVEFARAKQDLLTAAQEAGIKITPDLTKSIEGLAAGYANAVVASERLAEKQDEIRQRAEEAMATAKDVTRGLIDGFIEGADKADLLKDSLKKIADTLLNDVLNSIFKVNNAGSGGGGFLSSIFGSLFGGGGGKGYFPPAPAKFADGGYTGDGGKFQPAGVVHKGEFVFDKAAVAAAGGPSAMESMRRGLKGYANGGAVGVSVPTLPSIRSINPVAQQQPIDVRVSVDENGNLQAFVQRESAKTTRAGIQSYDKGSLGRTAMNVRQMGTRGLRG
ncbi:tape measure protein [Rhizobium skierniewicense]|uniref:tape measure protein n=1 Tax=Rhizobium skierniewicense TaxID=984260 RepID=UPI001FADEC76|nr:tape measure protein [Rhizobium skierniewicense]MCI9865810.1 tape measure protein [Rhizobium skierniewicense]